VSDSAKPDHDPMFHNAPLRHLVRQVLHPGRTLADQVKRLRYKRRKVKAPEMEVQP
jgi:hypothetical protein